MLFATRQNVRKHCAQIEAGEHPAEIQQARELDIARARAIDGPEMGNPAPAQNDVRELVGRLLR
eukprot:8017844-Alexandrium_andersonii.AAC.1